MSEANLHRRDAFAGWHRHLRVSSSLTTVREVEGRYGAVAKDWITAPGIRLRLRGVLCSVEQDGIVRLGDTLRKHISG